MCCLRPLRAPVALLLAIVMTASGCSSVVQIRPPYERKVRVGDQVHVTVGNKVLHGRIVYVDSNGLVIKTGKTVQQQHPVKVYTFTAQVAWSDVQRLRVDGVLDRRGKLIGEEEIRVNKRTGYQNSLMFNLGLLGFAASFGLGVLVQDRYFPPLGQKPISKLNDGRVAFWLTWMGGTAFSTFGGYTIGRILDRHRAIDRVEQIRSAEAVSGVDFLCEIPNIKLGSVSSESIVEERLSAISVRCQCHFFTLRDRDGYQAPNGLPR